MDAQAFAQYLAARPDLAEAAMSAVRHGAEQTDGLDQQTAHSLAELAQTLAAPAGASAAAKAVVYFVEATVSDAMLEGEAVHPDQATAVRFGPFHDYVELTYNQLRRGPDGTTIGCFDAEQDVWEIDGMLFSDLVIAAVDPADARGGSGLWIGERPPSTMRWPRLAY